MLRFAVHAAAIGAVLLTLSGAKTWAGFDEGETAYKHGDYATALREFRPLAEQGHPNAQYKLGNMYKNGDGVPQNYNEAAKWYRRAAEQGDEDAQFNLGFIYDKGQGVPQDDNEAAKWYRRAAEQGKRGAQANLGMMYYIGQGVPQNYNEAAKWYRRAAEQGLALPQYNLGVMYGEGQGVPRNYVRALMWFIIAELTLPPGEDRDKAISNRNTATDLMTFADIGEADRLAREWMAKHQAKKK